MILEAILVLTVLATGVVVCLDKVLYPRHSRLFRGKPKLVVLAESLFPVLVVILLLRSFTYEAFRIPSSSMKPTLVEGDVVVVDKYSLGLRLPILGYRLTKGNIQRGDVVVFRGEVAGESAGLIKRIVGLPGDHIQYSNRTLYVNGTPAAQIDLTIDTEKTADGSITKMIRATEDLGTKKHPIILSLQNTDGTFKYEDLIVPANSYFVLGDNRSNSLDSRFWGVLSDKQLVGKARLIVFSLDWPHKDIRWKRIGKVS